MSNCSKISGLLSAYMDGEVSEKEKQLVEAHLLECTFCKQKLDMMQKTKDILKDSPQMPVPETLFKDFGEYRKKTEQTEKKVVPLYKNYRVYASIAAVFVFAFVLKSGLWQEEKYIPSPLESSETNLTINAPVIKGTETTDAKDTAAEETMTPDSTVKTSKQADNRAKTEKPVPVEQAENSPASSAAVTVANNKVVSDAGTQPDAVPEVVTNDSIHLARELPDVAETDAAVAEAAITPSSGGGSSAIVAYNESQEASPVTETVEDSAVADEQVTAPAHAIVYVAEEDLDKAARLLSEGKYFYAQVEQKLSDNRIPFESNYLSLDEGIPHQVVVMVKEQ